MNKLAWITFVICLCGTGYGETTIITLDKAIELALENNLQLKQTEKDFRIAEAQYNGSIADCYVPQIKLSGNATFIDPTTVSNGEITLPPIAVYTPSGTTVPYAISAQTVYFDNYAASLSVIKPLFDGFRLWNSMKIKYLNYQLSIAKLEDMKKQVSSSVTISFYNLFLLRENINLTAELDRNLKERMDYTQANFKAGMTTQYDSIRAEVAYKNNHPVLLKINNAYKSAKMDFCNSIGLADYANTELAGGLRDSSNLQFATTEDEAIPLALSNDIGLRAIKSTILTLKLSNEVAGAARYPVLSAFFNDKFSYGMENLLAANRTWFNSWTTGLELSFALDSLLPFSKTAFTIEEMDENVKKVELFLEQSIQGITLKVRNLIMQIDQAKQAIESESGNMNQAKLGLDIVSSRYKAGSSSLLDVNDAEAIYTQSQLAYLQSTYDYFTSVIQLNRLIGR